MWVPIFNYTLTYIHHIYIYIYTCIIRKQCKILDYNILWLLYMDREQTKLEIHVECYINVGY
jgi:hypothetical protein